MKPSHPGVRDDTIESINNYVTKGWEPGSFVTAVMENNLMEALGQADMGNRLAIFEICEYVYNDTPATCHGSPEKVREWLLHGGLEGLQKESQR